jgi:IclR family transcriptional regulator, acetate operon repressor
VESGGSARLDICESSVKASPKTRGMTDSHSHEGDPGAPTSTTVRAIALHAVMMTAGTVMGLSDISRRAGIPKSTTHRLLGSLQAAGLVSRLGKGYRAVEQFGGPPRVVVRHRDLLHGLAPFVADLAMNLGVTAELAVLDGVEVVSAHRVHGHGVPWTAHDETDRVPANRTAAGRVLLARDPRSFCDAAAIWKMPSEEAAALSRDLAEIRRRGYAVTTEHGLTNLAVPLPLKAGQPLVALGARGHTARMSSARALHTMRGVVSSAAARAGGRLSAC